MKKWLSLYIAACAVVLCICGGVFGTVAAKEATFEGIQTEGGYRSQVIRADGTDYVLYRNPDQTKYQVVKTEQEKASYETLATAHKDGVYELYRFRENGEQWYGVEPLGLAKGEEKEEEDAWKPVLFEQTGDLLAFGNNEKGLLCTILHTGGDSVTEYYLPLDAPTEWLERQSYLLPEGHYPVAGAYEGEDLWIAFENGQIYKKTEILREQEVAFEDTILADRVGGTVADGGAGAWRLFQMGDVAVKCLAPVLMMMALVILYVSQRKKHLMVRLILSTELIGCIILLAAGCFMSERIQRQSISDMGAEAGEILNEIRFRQRADGTVEPMTYWTILESADQLLEDLMIVKPEDSHVLMAKKLPAGTLAYSYYSSDLAALVSKTVGARSALLTQLEGTGTHVVALSDKTDISSSTVLLAVLTSDCIRERADDQITTLWMLVVGLLALYSAAHLILYFIYDSRWRKLMKGASFVATEKTAFPVAPQKNDGLQSMWASLDRIGYNQSSMHYELEKLYKGYYRFVPKGMNVLLNKQELADMEVGDRNQIHGCMAHFVLEDMKQAESGAYMETITKTMEWIHQIRKKREGIYLSGTTDMLEQKLFFDQSADQALHFAVELLQALSLEETLAGRNMLLMLHTADFQYGITGVKDMTSPYMYSGQESILNPYAEPLAKAGVKLVLTEQTARAVSSGFFLRHIGFVSGGEALGSLKLYECVDAYSEKQRKLLMETETMFQKGLQLFYSNDFYLARNTFNEVLKINETDQIARWYLFRCEYQLSAADAEVTYGLFEDVISEQEYKTI